MTQARSDKRIAITFERACEIVEAATLITYIERVAKCEVVREAGRPVAITVAIEMDGGSNDGEIHREHCTDEWQFITGPSQLTLTASHGHQVQIVIGALVNIE